jgi:hypothetical protein
MDPAAVAAEPLPALRGFPFLHAGAGVLISGPTGGGRSSLVQACAYDAARTGVPVAYLGSEVTEAEFNARAADLASRRGDSIDDELREQLAAVRYLNLASVIARAWQDPDEWTAEIAGLFAVVLIDPLSSVASALDLDFDKSNAEFVRFYDRLVQPLASVGVAVVMLDNIGHALEARGRAKGVSAKQDRADLTFSCKLKTQPVGLIITAHKIRTVRAPFHRGDSWIFDRETQRVERSDSHQEQDDDTPFRPTVYMERVSRAVEDSPGLTRRALRGVVTGRHDMKELALELLVTEGYVEQRQAGAYPTHHSTAPFRADDDSGPTGPKLAPGASGTTLAPLAPHTRARGQGPLPFEAASNGAVTPIATGAKQAQSGGAQRAYPKDA